MARCDVYRRSPTGELLLDLQTDLLSIYDTRVVAPLVPAAEARPVTGHLTPFIDVEGLPHVLYVQFLGAVPNSALGLPHANVAAQADLVTRALDMLFHGF